MTVAAAPDRIRITMLGEDELVVRGLASILRDVPSLHLVTAREWRQRPETVDLVLVDTSRHRDVETLQRVVRSVPASAEVTRSALTTRETEVLSLIASGANNHQIAQLVRVSPNTVKSYVRSAYRKIDVDSRSRAVLWAVHNGLSSCAESTRVRLPQPAAVREDERLPQVRSASGT